MTPIPLLTIDDHPAVLLGLRWLFSADPRYVVCGEAGTPAEASRRAGELQPEMIVTDLVLGGADGMALIAELRAQAPRAKVLVYSSHDELLWARHAVQAGARGFVSKAEPLENVATALETVARGDLHLSVAVRRQLDAVPASSPLVKNDESALSSRELQVLTLIRGGRSLNDISQSLGVSVKTVGTYRERLKIKLGLDTARMLERFAVREGSGAPIAP